MAVIAPDFFKAVFGGGRKVDGIPSSHVARGRQAPCHAFDPMQKPLSDWDQSPEALLASSRTSTPSGSLR